MSDEALACRVQSGCADAFAALDRRMRPRLQAALAARLRDPGTRDDLVQETMLTAYRQIQRYDPQRPFRPWLMTIAFRLAIDEQRRRQARPAKPLPLTEPADHRPAPDASLAEREHRENLWADARACLPEAMYEVLWLRLGEGLEVSEVAEVLGRSKVHVRVLHHRAIGRLRKAMAGKRKDGEA